VRLGQLEEEFGDDVQITWRSFLLRPEPEERPMEAFTEYTTKWVRPASLEPRATFNTWSGLHQPPSHSFPSAIAGKVAAGFGPEVGKTFSDRLFHAYFTENRTISDRSVLREIAGQAGIDEASFDRRWGEQEDELIKDVWRDHATAVQSGINGVPAVVVNRRWLVPGAVGLDQYREAVTYARAHPEPAEGESEPG
jgi:predicted DsbA family dithiol-disulfide isomerase